jgi:hypothetical protein
MGSPLPLLDTIEITVQISIILDKTTDRQTFRLGGIAKLTRKFKGCHIIG